MKFTISNNTDIIYKPVDISYFHNSAHFPNWDLKIDIINNYIKHQTLFSLSEAILYLAHVKKKHEIHSGWDRSQFTIKPYENS